ncbi:methyltransferase domain-containing protein [Desulfobacterota bacterium M19]
MKLQANYSPFTTFCEGPEDTEKGYTLFFLFHRRNYSSLIPESQKSKILVSSSGVGYFQYSLRKWGYEDVKGIDSDPQKVKYAQIKGFNSECANCFDYLQETKEKYDLIFAEQEVNHLTRNEFRVFIKLCYNALKQNGRLIINAANSANPIIATEYLGNNIDHYTSFTENNMRQFFSLTDFNKVEVFPHDFYVLWRNPLNYVAKFTTGGLHIMLKILFKMYGKSNKIFTKRLGVIAIK